MSANTITFIGELHKNHTTYYFEIYPNRAYIEKIVESGYDDPDTFGDFSIEYARRCWKALKAKGFREYDSDEGRYLESATK